MGDVTRQSSLFPFMDLSGGTSRPVPPRGENEPGRTVNRKFLINKLNHLNFSGESVEFVFHNQEYANSRIVSAAPLPCNSPRCDFVWIEPVPDYSRFEGYALDSMRINSDDRQLIVVYPDEYLLGREGISLSLPITALVLDIDPEIAEHARDIRATIMQSGIRLQGELVKFSEASMLVRIDDFSAARWIEEDYSVHLVLESGDETVFSETCSIESIFASRGSRCYTLDVGNASIQRYRSRQYRSSRNRLQVSPLCRFAHPLSGRSVERRLDELSGSGFSYIEEKGASRLPAGVIIDKLELHFPEYSAITIKAQVIHRHLEEEPKRTRYGLCILNIDPQDHLVLLSLVQQSFNINSSLCKTVDLDRLWRFFFESGFIYPGKYALLQRQKEQIRQTFERLYSQRNNVARHFLYQKEDDILGHLSMVRYYERAWLLHHHASAGFRGENAGIHVLNQVGSFANDSCRFDNMHLDYLMCYFRPENHFPRRIFGGLAEFVNNPKICSVDQMAYYLLQEKRNEGDAFALWSIEEPREEDYIQVAMFYEEQSGGLLLEAMNLPPFAREETSNRGVLDAYTSMGIERRIVSRVVRHNGRLAAFFFVSISDPGINLSELTNSVTVFAVKPELLNRDILEYAAETIIRETGNSQTPVLVFPREAADSLKIPYEKSYTLWVMDTGIGDSYFEHIQSILRKVQP